MTNFQHFAFLLIIILTTIKSIEPCCNTSCSTNTNCCASNSNCCSSSSCCSSCQQSCSTPQCINTCQKSCCQQQESTTCKTISTSEKPEPEKERERDGHHDSSSKTDSISTDVNSSNIINNNNVINLTIAVNSQVENHINNHASGDASGGNDKEITGKPITPVVPTMRPSTGCCLVLVPCVSSRCRPIQQRCGRGCSSTYGYLPINPCEGGCSRRQTYERRTCSYESCSTGTVDCSQCGDDFYQTFDGYSKCQGCFYQ